MKAQAVIAAALIALAAPTGAYADWIADPNGLAQAFEACAANKRLFDIEVGKLNQTISANSQEYNLTGGTLTYGSTMVWRRDLRMLSHFFEDDWNSVVHDTGVTVGRCNAVINFYSRCVEELWGDAVATVSVRRPTGGCLGRLYDRYGDMPDESYQHGRRKHVTHMFPASSAKPQNLKFSVLSATRPRWVTTASPLITSLHAPLSSTTARPYRSCSIGLLVPSDWAVGTS